MDNFNKNSNLLNLRDIIFITIGGLTLGIFWWGFTFIHPFFSSFLKPFGLEGLLTGLWYMGGIIFPYIIRKPGSALLGECIASITEGLITHWGLIPTLIFGFSQAILPEILFLLFKYKYFNWYIILFAGALAGFGGSICSIIYYARWNLGYTYSCKTLDNAYN